MWRPADAIFSMANYLRAAGAPADWPAAIFAYNHAWWYVADVLAWARRYRAQY
jgi:membrane-bound lytic murein transglycosylase B